MSTTFNAERATVLAIDCSWEHELRRTFGLYREAALALDRVITAEYPQHILLPVAYASYAVPIGREQLASLDVARGSLGTNLQHAFMLARQMLLGFEQARKSIVVLCAGEPTAHMEGDRSYFAMPPSVVNVNATVREARACSEAKIRVTLLAPAAGYWIKQFGAKLAERADVEFIACETERLADATIAAYER